MMFRAGMIWLVAQSLLATEAFGDVERSPFPRARVPVASVQHHPPARHEAMGLLAPRTSLRPVARPVRLAAGRPVGADAPQATAPQAPRDAEFAQWLRGFRSRALGQGIRAAVFDRAFEGVRPDRQVLSRETNQPEFNRPIWDYLDSAVSTSRIENGQRMLREHRRILDEIEARYGVEREVVVAVWGLESAYGRLRGTTALIPALTALAMGSRRAGFYEEQLIGALRILQAGDVDARHLVGSWAGAMGHTQFIPTSYLAYAVDFRGDGRRDIWSDDPTDSLASTAAYLARHGWERGQPWGVEVRLPRGFNPRLANSRRPVQDWRAQGIEPVRGAILPQTGEATLLFPAGSRGPALLVFQNFRVIKRYNNADAYAIAIGHLADRLRGGGGFQGEWPRGDRPLNRAEREELQRLLARSGHYGGAIDGRIGQGTMAGVRDWQAANGLPPDGYVSLALLQAMRR